MASSGSFNTNAYEVRYLEFNWSVKSQSTVSNTTTINWSLAGAGGSENYPYQAGNFKVTIDGNTVYSTAQNNRIKLYNGTTVASGTYTINHNGDGTRSFTVTAQAGIYTYAVNCKGAGTWSLPAISRASTINSFTGDDVDGTFSVNYTSYSSKFTDRLQITAPSGKVLENFIYSSGASFSLSQSSVEYLYSATQNSKSINLTAKIITYSGEDKVGESTAETNTVYIKNADPTIGTIGYADTNATTLAITKDSSKVIQNFSTVNFTLTNLNAVKNAILKKITIDINGNTKMATLTGASIATQNVDVGALDVSSDIIAAITVTDSRGNSQTYNKKISILSYSAPTALIDCNRKNNYSTEATLSANATFSSLNEKNSLKVQYQTKATTDTSYSDLTEIENNTPTALELDNKKSWDVRVILSDRLSTATYNLQVGKGIPLIFYDVLNSSVGMNCFPASQNALAVNGYNLAIEELTAWDTGYYIKWADGRLDIYGYIKTTQVTQTAWGSLYISETFSLGDYPVPFIYRPSTVMSLQNYNNSNSSMGWLVAGSGASNTSLGNAQIAQGTISNVATEYTISYHATGLWREYKQD